MGVPEEVTDPEGGNKSAMGTLDNKQIPATNDGSRFGSRKLILGILFVVVIAVGAIVASVLLVKSGENSKTGAAHPLANSPEICDVISQGGLVPNQDTMILKAYKITMDVSLKSNQMTPASAVKELESMFQVKLGPKFADCPGSRRLRLVNDENLNESRELLLEEHIVGNVIFALAQDSAASCNAGAPTPCIVVDANMALYLKKEQNVLSVLNRISTLFQENSLKRILDLSDPFEKITATDLEETIPVLSSTPSPTKAPLYPPNTPADCERIAEGQPVALQDSLIKVTFDVRMDVSLTLLLFDVTEVVDEMESRMQRILGPQLADCEGAATSQSNSIERNVIGNVLFDVFHQEEASCDLYSPTSCIRAVTRLTLMLKDEEDMLPLANRITSIFGSAPLTEELGLTAPFNDLVVVGVTRTIFTMQPSSSPTVYSIYNANSAQTCASISNKELVPDQDSMVVQGFDIRFDVSLTLFLSNLSEVVKEMEERLQRYIAPKLADCRGYRRLLLNEDYNRQLLDDRNVIGNAQFFLFHQPDESCDSSAKGPCFRVLGKLNVYLKGDQGTLTVANHITMAIGNLMQDLQLTTPFVKIQPIGLTALANPFVPIPTIAPTRIPTRAPTNIPTVPPTPIPTGVPTVTWAPTPIPGPISQDDCAAISSGLPVPYQKRMSVVDFDIQMSVRLTLQLSDLSEVVDEL